ncbi:MAG: 3-dehydroquinate synthase [Chloroflexota bacterium]
MDINQEKLLKLPVNHPTGSYPVYVGYALLNKIGELSGTPDHVAVITDTNVGPLYAKRVAAQWEHCVIVEVPAGEAHKTLETVNQIYSQMFAAGCDRQTTIVALGGGVINDMAGFVAATFMRGIRFVTCPTTLLAMADASVGGKTGVDMPEGKNLVGAFKQPEAVFADLNVLKSLPSDEFACGMAESIKHGLLSNRDLLPKILEREWHADLQQGFAPLEEKAFQQLVQDVIMVKRDVVERDPFEKGDRALLNLGHTFGHAIEHVTQFGVKHGEGVAMGLVCAANLSAKLDYCDPDLQLEIEAILEKAHLPTRLPKIDPEAILDAMQQDKKKKGKSLRFILLRGKEDAFIAKDVPDKLVIETLLELTQN